MSGMWNVIGVLKQVTQKAFLLSLYRLQTREFDCGTLDILTSSTQF